MDKTSFHDLLANPLAKDHHFLHWLESHQELDAGSAFEEYNKIYKDKKEGRLYMDGAFDVVHSGHYNAIRQAKQLCHTLVVGVNSDADITIHKGPPIMNIQERCCLVEACKWTDEVAGGTAYLPTIELIDQLNCQYIGHGDDIIYGSDGKSIYSAFEDAGRMK